MSNLSPHAVATGVPSSAALTQQLAAIAKRVKRPSDAGQQTLAESFANVVAVLMRDPRFRTLRLADLEWLVLPSLLLGQWRLAHSTAALPIARAEPTQANAMVPVAVALWATVSPEIDQRLSSNLDQPLLLRSNEWATGNIPWLIAVAGDRRAVPQFLKQLHETEFKGQQVKLRAMGPGGKVSVSTLGQSRS